MAKRDPLAAIIEQNRPFAQAEHAVLADDGKTNLTKIAVARKLDALVASPFGFFRGTFPIFASDVAAADSVLGSGAPSAEVVGDLHLENFGAYRGKEELVFDVNDFDEVTHFAVDIDLARLATSVLLVDGPPVAEKEQAVTALVRAAAEEMARLGGKFPVRAITREKAVGRVREILDERRTETSEAFLKANTKGLGRSMRLNMGDPLTAKYTALERDRAKEAARALASYATAHAADVSIKEVIDVAYRFKGTGSLGRYRVSLLVRCEKDRLRIFEIKEALTSALDVARGAPLRTPQRGAAIASAIRRLQGDPWPSVGATSLWGVSALVREIQPEEEKLRVGRYAHSGRELADYAAQCGRAMVRLHLRGGARALLESEMAAKGEALVPRTLEFARRCAKQVIDDHATLRQNQARVRSAIGV